MRNWLLNIIPKNGILGVDQESVTVIIMLLFSIGIAIVATRIVRQIVTRLFTRIKFQKYEHQSDIFKQHKVFKRCSAIIAPACLIFLILSIFPAEDVGDLLFATTSKALFVYLYITIWNFLIALLSAINDLLSRKTRKSVHGFIQTLQLLITIVLIILIVSTLADKSPIKILAGIGASAAVMMFIFKDALLGFVASVLLSTNDMLEIGDWITMDKYNTDGVVVEIGLTVVKVQNWDNTITNIPTYTLVSDSYQNWRGMSQSGGRRVMRHILIDMQSVKFCDAKMIEHLKKISLLKDYFENKEKELGDLKNLNDDPLNNRKITNLEVFRAYLERYLENNPNVILSMLHFVREGQPTSTGLPLELYFFTTTDWVAYENVQSEVFDHVISAVPEFGLRIYQEESDAETQSSGI